MRLPKRLERRKRTYNVIRRRWNLLMGWMQPMGSETKEEAESKQTFTPHHLHKYNLNCGCGSCRANKQYDKYKRTEMKRETKRIIGDLE